MTMTISPPPASSTSPMRSSPLSGKAAMLKRPVPIPRPIATQQQPATPTSTAAATAGTPPSSLGSPLSTTSTSLSRSQPLIGSYGLSLLQRRMSAHAPHAVDTFSLRVRAIATGPCPPALRAPQALSIPFTATYYDLADGVNTPWVADVDLESWFFTSYGGGADSNSGSSGTASSASTTSSVNSGAQSQNHHLHHQLVKPGAFAATYVASSPTALATMSAPGLASSAPASTTSIASSLPSPPHYPGYRVPPVGQLQLLITTPSTAVKAFVVPYDLRKLSVGGRLLARERTFVRQESTTPTTATASMSSPSATPRESLRFAVQLQFTCAAAPPSEAEFGDHRAFYVSRTLKLVFSSALERDADVRDERADELVPPPSATSSPPASPAASEWSRTRKRYLVRNGHGVRTKPSTKVRRAVGFSPPRERPASPLPPGASPRSLLSAFAPEDSSTTPTPTPSAPSSRSGSRAGFARGAPMLVSGLTAERATSPLPPPGSAPAAGGVQKQRRRRSWRAEHELSERLRALELGGDDSDIGKRA